MQTCVRLFLLTAALSSLAADPSDSGPYAVALSLPISIQNEVDVAIENGRAYLAEHQSDDGLWNVSGPASSSLPAFAFLEPTAPGVMPPEPLRRAFRAAFRRLSSSLPHRQQPDSTRTLAEDALVVVASLTVFDAPTLLDGGEDTSLLAAVRRRLSAIQLTDQSPVTAWLCRTSLDLLRGPAPDSGRWDSLYDALARTTSPHPRDVALAGYARLRHGPPADTPDALLAHLRWLRAHTAPFSAAPATPEDLYFLTVFLDTLPPALPASVGFPADWRTRIAQRLIATARSAGGTTCWPAGTASQTIRQTLFAVATLVGL